eukprot:Colp12_sorted_trinity150504_noHs@4074
MATLEAAEKLVASNPDEAIKILDGLVKSEGSDEEHLKVKEAAILKLGNLLARQKRPQELSALVTTVQSFVGSLPKAKAAKLMRTLVDDYLSMELPSADGVNLCLNCIEWAKQERRVFLRQGLEARLVGLYLDMKNYTASLQLAASLLKELKKLDDKALLVEIQLLESRNYYALKNLPKARASLTSARTSANAIYCPPKLQAALDIQSGILHAEEKDFKTAYSYLYESFEGYDSVENPKALSALKYMLLCKIMLNLPDDVQSVLSGKLALRYQGKELDAMKAVAQAHHNRSLAQFEKALEQYKKELTEDPIIASHMNALYDTLLEQNLLRLIEPFSRVELQHLADLIQLELRVVENKLSQMILDKKLHGILDQGAGCLVVFDEPSIDKTYEATIDTIGHISKVVDALYKKAKRLS